MSTFTIDFTELCFLAEACIPPRPIARTMFWESLTNTYWKQMTLFERKHIFKWLNMNPSYKDGLEKGNEYIKVFHARFDPDNQYKLFTNFSGEESEYEAFKMGDKYYINTSSFIAPEYIMKVEKIEYNDGGE